MTLSNVAATRASLFRIQLLVGCGGLAVNLGHYRGAVSSGCPSVALPGRMLTTSLLCVPDLQMFVSLFFLLCHLVLSLIQTAFLTPC